MYSQKRFTGFLAAGAMASLSLMAASPAFAQFGTNLVVNSGAEAGPGSTGGPAVSSIPGWQSNSGATVVNYINNAGFPVATSPGPSNRGAQFFAGGWSANSQLSQIIDVHFAAAAIDAKAAIFNVSGWLGGYYTDNDNCIISVYYFSESWSLLGSGTGTDLPNYATPVNAAERKNVTGMLLKQTSGIVPAGTRWVLFTVNFYRTAGSYNDAYADNLYFSLRDAGE